MTMKTMLHVLQGHTASTPPVWMMRQAGRYLPEYREVRKGAGSFLDLCYSPRLASEVTLQPIRRYGFDAAILFADILVVPDALGQRVDFLEGEGPVLEPITGEGQLASLKPDNIDRHLAPVYETLQRLRQDLPKETTLIGFCGAPWTVATYMVGGRGSPDQKQARLWAYRDPDGFQKLIDLLVDASVTYLSSQIRAGAEVVQLFDSWASNLAPEEFRRWCVEPVRIMGERLKALHPAVPVIGFPRGAGEKYRQFVEATGVDGVSLDTSMDIEWARDHLQDKTVLQGNLDPVSVVNGGWRLDEDVDRIVEILGGKPFIFNLGHGLTPDTPPENVARVIERIRKPVA